MIPLLSTEKIVVEALSTTSKARPVVVELPHTESAEYPVEVPIVTDPENTPD